MATRREAKLFGALGSEVRLRILELVSAHREMCLCELVEALGLSQATLSRHVAVLREAGLLRDRRLNNMLLLRVERTPLAESVEGLLARLHENEKASEQEDVEARLAQRCRE